MSNNNQPDVGPYRQRFSQIVTMMRLPHVEDAAGLDIARILPVAMVFTPCRDGITHNINEEIDLARTVPGVNLFLNAVLRRANRE
jgi:acetylornithine deacetylase/succinyl-diaminopimelate desuccinylase-like protein